MQLYAKYYGNEVENLPEDIKFLYEEARELSHAINEGPIKKCTSTVLLCRKILMHVAFDKEFPGGNFVQALNYLVSKDVITKNHKEKIDSIRNLGNEANHERIINNHDDAKRVMKLLESLLLEVYCV